MRLARWLIDEDELALDIADGKATSSGARAIIAGATGSKRRPPFLHEVRLPNGAVERCKVCDAAIALPGCCRDSIGLKIHHPREGYWQRLEREATEKAARLDRSGDPHNEDEDEDSFEVLEET